MTATSSLVTKAIVTGHTRGLGAALVDALLAQGIAVLGLARSSRPPVSGGARAPGTFAEVELDLADSHRLAQWLAGDTLATFLRGAGRALLINNAGMVGPIGPCSVQAVDDVGRAVALNVAAPLILSSAFVAATGETPDRRIAHVSSGAARNAYAGWNVYCATKAALDHHARAAALDAERGLLVASVAPGVVDTDMQGEIRGTDDARFPLRGRFEEMKRSGQLSSPEQAASKFVGYLLSDAFGETPIADIRTL
jgi:NAD(P)-dependent dehydrogenase (short-subunit alcohol dehydrogenase family)